MAKISQVHAELLRLMIISEPTIMSKMLLLDSNEKEKPSTVEVTENGSINFYYGSGPLWWQRLFNRYERYSLVDVGIKIADAITGSSNARNETAFDGITKAILDEAIKKQNYDCVIDILFDSMRNCTDGPLHSTYINQENIKKYAKEHPQGIKNINGLYGMCAIEIRPGKQIPIVLGRVVSTNNN